MYLCSNGIEEGVFQKYFNSNFLLQINKFILSYTCINCMCAVVILTDNIESSLKLILKGEVFIFRCEIILIRNVWT